MPEKEPPITQQDELIEAVYEFADDELQAGTYPGDIEKMLIAKGLDPESARNAVEHVVKAQLSDVPAVEPISRPRSGMANMGIGAIVCAVGISATFFSYVAASEMGGGKYIVAWGAILFVLFSSFEEFTKWKLSRTKPKPAGTQRRCCISPKRRPFDRISIW